MQKFTLTIATAVIAASCQANAVHTIETTALEHGSTLATIMESQVLRNLQRLHQDEHAIPEHIVINAGSAQVNSSAGQSLSAALIPGADTYGIGADSSVGLTANWGLAPVTDRLQLERLRFFYVWVIAKATGKNPLAECEHCLQIESPKGSTMSALESYLLHLFGSRDSLGRRNAVKWTIVKYDDHEDLVKLDKDGNPVYTAHWISPEDEVATLLEATANIPTGWHAFDPESNQVSITDQGKFRDFVLLTLSPTLQSIDGTNRLSAAPLGGAPRFHPYVQPLLLDPND